MARVLPHRCYANVHYLCRRLYRFPTNGRHLSDDSKNSANDDSSNSSSSDGKEETNDDTSLTLAKQRDDRVENARRKLAELITEMKVDTSLMKSESLSKVMAKPKYHIRKSARNEEPPPTEENIDNISKGIDKRLVFAAKVIANTLSGDKAKETESELLKLLRAHASETEAAKLAKQPNTHDLASVFLGIKVDRERKKSPSEQLSPRPKRYTSPTLKYRSPQTSDRSNLYVSEPLGIFDADMRATTEESHTIGSTRMSIWERLLNDEVERTVIHPPRNAYEEMISWTQQGKLWKFPIDNEQGLEDEAKVPFYEHVMLDHLLEGFPEKGPVRQFMELVILGLSNNPYITVERKHATVGYYKEFFKEHEGILRAAGALS